MRVAIVGAGALGCVYGARLARFGGCEVSLVTRTAAPGRVVRLERVEDGEVLEWTSPARVDAVPAAAEVVVACVRYEQLDAMAARVAQGPAVPVVMLTPMLPADFARLAATLGARVVPGMPSVVSYFNDAGALRYWLPRVATTLVDEREPAGAERELVRALGRAEIDARVETDVLSRNVATTVTFVPLAMALEIAGGVDAALGDDALLSLALDAAGEGRDIARGVGKAAAWASTLARFIGPLTVKVGVGLAKSRAPEAVRYVDLHFGRKLHAQNVAMAEGMVKLAEEQGVEHARLAELLERLKAMPAAGP
jgi:ketopantoate reductase